MKKFLLSIFCFMLTAVSINAEEVTGKITFKTAGSDASTAATASNFVSNQITSSDFENLTCSATNNCYTGTAGLKMSSSKANGSFTLNLGTTLNVKTITVNAVKYKTDATKLSVNGSTAVSLNTAATDHTFEVNSEISTIKVDMTKRGYIASIAITYATEDGATPVTSKPIFTPSSCTFEESLEVTISAEEGATIYYTVDGTEPTTESNEYAEALTIEETTTVNAIAVLDGVESSVASAKYTKLEAKTIEEVIAAGAGEALTTGTVVATYNSGFLMGDETGHILVYRGKANIGDVVKVMGTTSKYNSLLQFAEGATVITTGTAEVTYPEVTVMDGAAMDAYLAAPYVKYVEYTGVLTISGNYYNVAIEGATKAQGSISYPAAGLVTAKSGETVKVTGYTIGVSSSKYVNTMAVKVEKIEPLVPTSVVRTNKAVEYQLKGVQLMFDEVVTATTPENGEYGYVLNAAGEKVFTFDKMSGGTGVGKFASFSNSDYSAVIETPGEYKVVITTVITGESGKVYKGGEYAFTVTKHPVEVERSVEFWGTVKTLPLNIDITINYADVIELDEIKKVTYITGETTYEAVVTKVENVISIAFDENVEYAEGDYTFNVPAGLYTADGEANEAIAEEFTYKKPVPLKVLEIQPAEGEVESISTITILFNQAIEPNYMFEMGNRLFMRTNGWEASTVVEYTACDGNGEPSPITEAGEYVFDVTLVTEFLAEGEKTTYTWTIAAPVEPEPELEALEAVSYDRNPLETAINGQYKLQGVKINFGEVVKKYTTDLTGDYGYILDAEGNEVARLNKCMGGNGTSNDFATPYSATAIETPGTYKVVVLPGVIFNADGTKEYKGGEFEFTVAERTVEISPSAEEGFCWNETYENVADFSEFVITVKYAKSDVVINNDVKATMTTGETVYEATVTVEKSGNTQYITLAFDGEFAEGRYTINVPAGLFTVDGVANEEYAKSTFTYREPQLEISRDFDTWESYLDQVWYMPTAAMITIANAESVEVDETKVATITFGETVYTSTLNYNYDEWSNAHYIEYQFEDFFAEGFEFVKGDYTFTLPAGAYTVNGEANEEAVKTYTYGDPIIEEFTVTEILPAPGSVLESIDAISITFSNGMAADYLPVTCGDKTYYFVSMSGVYVPVDMNTYEPIVITEPGTYTLDLSNLEGLTGDKVFTWTIGTVEPEPEPEPGVDYTPTYTGTKTYENWGTTRNITTITLDDNSYDLPADVQSMCYVDATEAAIFIVEANSDVKVTVTYNGTWIHHAVFIDFDGDGFTSGLEEGSEWKPAGDLVAYSFYNNGGTSDENGWNSIGTLISGNNRNNPEIPEFAVPTTPGTYRMRFVQDWCSIDPNGDSDGKFGDFMDNGGQIVDVTLVVTEPTGIENVEAEAEQTIYDLTGRKIETITKPGIYIVGGRKVLVK